MKITLTNFRCHKNLQLVIPNQGLIHLNGISGLGKSTIFNAIVYCLYNSIRSPCTYSERSCCVLIEFEDVIVERKSGPAFLKVLYKNETYKNDEAQAIIDQLFGNQELFLLSSYIKQSSSNSIVSMKASEQTSFIENLVLNNEQTLKVKKRIKDNITQRESELSEIRNKLQIMQSQYEEKSEEYDSVKYDESIDTKDYTVESIAEAIATLREKIDKETKVYESMIQERDEMSDRLEEIKRQKLDRDRNLLEIESIESKLEEMKVYDLEEQSEVLHNLEKAMEQAKKYEEYKTKKKELEELQNTFFETLEKEVEEFESVNSKYLNVELDSIEDEIEACEKEKILFEKKQQYISRFKDYNPNSSLTKKNFKSLISKEIKSFSDDLENAENELKLCNKTIVVCPCCKNKVEFHDNKLVKISGKTTPQKTDKKQLQAEIEGLKVAVDELKEILSFFESLDDFDVSDPSKDIKFYKKVRSLIPEIQKYNENKSMLSEHRLPKIYSDMKEKLKKVEKPELPYKTLKTQYDSERELYETYKRSNQQVDEYDLRLQVLRNAIEVEDESMNLESYEELDSKARTSSEKQLKLAKQLESYLHIQKALQDKSRFERFKKSYEKLQLTITEYENNEKEAIRQLDAAKKLEVASKNTDVLAISTTLNDINAYAKEYLDRMFDTPIEVKLLSGKHKKDGSVNNSKIGLYICYKGYEYTDIDALSGGERQRIELAFILALNDKCGSNILLLDECINNLDSDKNSEVLEVIKESTKDKLILVISHEAIVDNLFDEVIDLE